MWVIIILVTWAVAFQQSGRWDRTVSMRASQLAQLAEMTTLSIDSGDLDVIEHWAATGLITDCTTNPLFVAQASGDERYAAFVDRAIAYAKERASGDAAVQLAMDRLAVELGLAIVKLVPGYVSTEVDIKASFDTDETVRRARRVVAMYEEEGVARSRVLVKIAGTLEGLRAAAILEKEGITCNITLVFGFVQAVLAGQAKARLISPFPGRVLDWWKQKDGFATCEPDDDPGVVAVKRMSAYYKTYGMENTICMPASWRPSRGTSNAAFGVDEILALAGVDRMTIPPPLLQLLADSDEPVERKISTSSQDDEIPPLSDSDFRLMMNADVCATTKLAEGINAFIAETQKLETAIRAKLKP